MVSVTDSADSSILTPRGVTQAALLGQALGLCERGRPGEAARLISDTGACPERMLIEGCVLFFTQPEAAKDVVSRAIRSLPEGELKEKGGIWLASCYWATGESREARAFLDAVKPSSDPIRFLKGLNASIFQSTKLRAAVASLSKVEDLVDSVPDLYRAKFFLQRGWLNRRLNKIDAAIIDYEAAKVLFEISAAPRYLAVATNNLAGLLIDARRFEDAHSAVDSAITSLPASDALYLAQIYDQKAQIFIAENKHVEAETTAGRSVALLSTTENKSILAESLLTHAKALRYLEMYVAALNRLDEAKRIAEYLGNSNILISITKEQKETAQAFAQKAHLQLVETALDAAGGSIRGAARLVGVKMQPLDRFIRLHKINRHPQVRKTRHR